MDSVRKFTDCVIRTGRSVRTLSLPMLLSVAGLALAQPVAWPIATLQPPGFDVPGGPLAGVATTGEFAVTAYGPMAESGYRVFARKRVAGVWQAPELVAQGPVSDGTVWQVVADGNIIAVGLAEASIYGRVDVDRRDEPSSTWTKEQSITSAPPVGWQKFGASLSLRNSLLVVGSQFGWGGRVETFRRDSATARWHDADFTRFSSYRLNAKTDGERIAVCGVSSCYTAQQDGTGVWQDEGWLPGSNSDAVVDGDWLLATSYSGPGYVLNVYKRVAGQWQFQQILINNQSSREVVGGGGTVAILDAGSVVKVVSLDGDDVWRIKASLDMPDGGSYPLAVADGIVLANTQSFSNTGNGWTATGTVDGIPNTGQSGFGSAVEIVNGRVWIGEPGHNTDYRAGAVWLQALDGIIPMTPSELIVPPQPSIGMALGGAIDSDGAHVVVASYPWSSNDGETVRVYDATIPFSNGISLPVPAAGQWLGQVDVAINDDTVVLSRQGSGALTLDVFRKDGSGYPVVQTIIPPTLTYPNQGSGGANIVLSDQWLLAGPRRYQRVAGTYVDRGNLESPAADTGVVYDFTRIVEGEGFVVAPVLSDESGLRLAAVFASDPAKGWIYRGVVKKAVADSSVCKTMAASESAIVCMPVNSDQLRVAIPDGASGNWQVAGSVTIPGTTISSNTYYPLAVAGERVAVGLASEARVVILSLSEFVFGAGFDG